MTVRAARPADAAAIRALNDAAFAGPAEGTLAGALREAGDVAVELVAEEEGRIVGHIVLSRLEAPEGALALAPMAVAPGLQRAGRGGALIGAALREAEAKGFAAVFVLGEPAYYERFGFSRAAASRFDTPYPKDYTMALALAPGGLEKLSGALVYAKAFAAL